MAYKYSNPFMSSPAVSSPAQSSPAFPRSTFAAVSGSSVGYQVLLGGLPLDVLEKDLRELLLAQPMNLPATTTQVKCFHSSTGQFLGYALVQVGHEVDAERLRLEYSGQIIDGTYHLTVQHLLAPTQSLPSRSVQPFAAPAAVPPEPQATPPSKPRPPRPSGTPNGTGKNGTPEDKPGLKLLRRMSKPGQGKATGSGDTQLSLLAQQKANLHKSPRGSPFQSPRGSHLFSRLGSSPHSAAKTRPNQQRLSSGTNKVGRAKMSAAKDAMEVDQDLVRVVSKKRKSEPKTQRELDEEMRVWERARKFSAPSST